MISSITPWAIGIALLAVAALGVTTKFYQMKYKAEVALTDGLKIERDRLSGQLTVARDQARREYAANMKNIAEREALRRQTETAIHDYETAQRSECDLTVLPDASVRLLNPNRVPATGSDQPSSNLGTP